MNWIKGLGFSVLMLTIVTCGGCPEQTAAAQAIAWAMGAPAIATGPPGGSAYFDVALSRDSTRAVGVTLEVTAPAGWSASPASSSVNIAPGGNTVRVTVQIAPGAAVGSVGEVQLKATRVGGDVLDFKTRIVRVTVGSNAATAITKLTDFESRPDGLWTSRFRVENGIPFGLIGSLETQVVSNVIYWYRPDNVLNLDVNASKEYEVVAIVRDSVNGVGSHNVSPRFWKDGTLYSYTSMFSLAGNNERGFRIDPVDQNIRASQVGDEAVYHINVDLPPGKAGVVTPSMEALDPSMSASFSPPVGNFGAAGGTVEFVVTIRRNQPHPTQGYTAYEPVFVARHDSKPECNIRQIIPIFSAP